LVFVDYNRERGEQLYSIGEFSRISGLSIKALRLYHEMGLLVPAKIDEETLYRYYNHRNAERARIISNLKALEFSLDEIAHLLKKANDEADGLDFFEKRKEEILAKIAKQRKIVSQLNTIIDIEKEAQMANGDHFEVEEKQIDKILVAGIRFKGKYNEVGDKFGKIAKKMGRHINGKPLDLYYDAEYKEEGADIEVAFPVRKGEDSDGVKVHELEGGKAVALIHKGPYEDIGRSYEKIMGYINEKGYKPKVPSREVYIKGPGMIFKGNPKNYLTEIQILVD